MRISVKAKPNSRVTSVEKISDTEYSVKVKAPATEGRANEAVIEALSDHFKVPKSRINILRGAGAKHKIVEII